MTAICPGRIARHGHGHEPRARPFSGRDDDPDTYCADARRIFAGHVPQGKPCYPARVTLRITRPLFGIAGIRDRETRRSCVGTS